ncbi:MAG: hypothetical protein AB4372_30705 [Xenococcus sp. (in: cyanobacteria)]
MFNEKIEQLSESDISYISGQIKKLETEYKDKPLATKNAMWRIASNAQLFPPNELDPGGILTAEQRQKTWAFIQFFKNRDNPQMLLFISRIMESQGIAY